MSPAAAPRLVLDDDVRIPLDVGGSLERFRAWVQSEESPDHGRIDYLDGDLEVDMSPEDLYTHGVVKSAVAAALHEWVTEAGAGNVFIDRTRVSAPAAGLSAEPDVVVVLAESLDAGRVREVAAASGAEGRYVELEGGPDLVVEIVSDRSRGKDRERLPRLYARAGVRELWLVDARGAELTLDVWRLGPGERLEAVAADADGFVASAVLRRRVRLTRELDPRQRWRYRVESRA